MIDVKSKVKCEMKEINNLFKRLETLEKYSVEYGYFEGDVHKNSGLDIAHLAEMLNYGTDDIIARPFMSMANDSAQRYSESSNEWKRWLWGYLKNGGRITQFLHKVGVACNRFIPQAILYGGWESNSDWWAKVKFEKYGESQPLIETRELMDSSKVRIVRNSNEN